jgi:chromosome partitioning protein
MAIISFFNSKGGVGKSTTALIVAQVLAHHGRHVCLIDADPNQPQLAWQNIDPERVPDTLNIIGNVTENDILDVLDKVDTKNTTAIVDLEGSSNMSAMAALSRSDLVVIPIQGSQMDANQAASVVGVLRQQERIIGRKIPFTIIFTRTTALRDKNIRHIQQTIKEAQLPLLPVHMVERSAFRTIMQIGGSIYDLSSKEVNNPAAAIENAEAVTAAIAEYMKQNQMEGVA